MMKYTETHWKISGTYHGCQLEAVEQGTVKIVANKRESNQGELYQVARIYKPGRYSGNKKTPSKIERSYVQQFKNKKCETCSFRTYPEKKGPASEYKCFDCQKRDIFVVHKTKPVEWKVIQSRLMKM